MRKYEWYFAKIIYRLLIRNISDQVVYFRLQLAEFGRGSSREYRVVDPGIMANKSFLYVQVVYRVVDLGIMAKKSFLSIKVVYTVWTGW